MNFSDSLILSNIKNFMTSKGNKKVLFITYYWPPAGGAPVMRTLKLYEYLNEFGYEPIILTVDNGDFPVVDHSLESIVRKDTLVYKTPNISLHKFFRFLSFSKKKDFKPYEQTDDTVKSLKSRIARWGKFNIIPDTRILWSLTATRKALQIAKKHNVDLIFSSSPPQTNHIIAASVSKKLKIPWIGDFRDPWTDDFWLVNPNSPRLRFIHKLDQRIERSTLQKMSAITTVNPSMVEMLKNKVEKKIYLITNGYDHRLFESVERRPNSYFTISFLGSMSKEHTPIPFFKALKKISAEISPEKLKFVLVGNFVPFAYEQIKKYEIEQYFEYKNFVPFKEALQLMVNADVLLYMVPDIPNNKMICASKIFEYLGAGRPILAIGPTDGDTAKIINEAQAGKMFDYEDVDGIANYIYDLFSRYSRGEDLSIAPKNREKYTRRAIAQKFAEVFDEVVVMKQNK